MPQIDKCDRHDATFIDRCNVAKMSTPIKLSNCNLIRKPYYSWRGSKYPFNMEVNNSSDSKKKQYTTECLQKIFRL